MLLKGTVTVVILRFCKFYLHHKEFTEKVVTFLWAWHDNVCTKYLTSMSSVLFHGNTAMVNIGIES